MAGDGAQAIFGHMSGDALLFQRVQERYDPDRPPLAQSYRLSQEVYRVARAWQRRFTHTQQADYLPRDERGYVHNGAALRTWQGHDVQRLLDENPGESVMFLATCGYMLEGLIKELRGAGIPFHNPLRPTNAKWNPLPRRKGTKGGTIVDKVLDFSRSSSLLWGENARGWTTDELQRWASALPAKGMMRRGAKKKLEALAAREEEDVAVDVQHAQRFFMEWFEPEVLGRVVPEPDIDWYLSKVQGSQSLRTFVERVIAQQSMQALEETPRVVVGSIHSCKGGEADIVVLSPDISVEAFLAAKRDAQRAEEMKRVFYVGMTRARRGLICCAPSDRTHVYW